MWLFFGLLLAVLLTSILSGVLGMGGGMILIGVFAMLLPVPAAMVLHGVTQTGANGTRTWLFRQHIYRPTLAPFFAGMAISAATVIASGLVLDKSTLFLVLGAIPFLNLLPKMPQLDFTRPGHAFLCGLCVTFAQMTAGVSGPLLDVFFLDTKLDRFQVIGTKSFTQMLGHLLKIGYFGAVMWRAGSEAELPIWIFPGVVLVGMTGTIIGRKLLEFLNEARFRQACSWTVLTIGGVYLARGIGPLLG
ncbi:putative membrane transporter protein [Sulfidibacter corallicola]|uniref:Probable membrane transporter protein n=1 Tax=Sulfidibacter corallicola TaxID=2818388 RepID=A0A8A4U3A9_SULCO|nr:TSUP family transporter [Sulfidibacter corallicola]QTD53225.1 TSUP family transporter [Sulfidibacter corallicola]